MKKGLVLVAWGMLSCMAAGTAFAGPFGGRFARMPRPAQQQRMQDDAREDESNPEKDRAEKERVERERIDRERADKERIEKSAPQQAGPAAREEVKQGGNPGQAQGGPPGGRGGARMSVEERQKLRHQINEAGHSLYTLPPASGNK